RLKLLEALATTGQVAGLGRLFDGGEAFVATMVFVGEKLGDDSHGSNPALDEIAFDYARTGWGIP
ncbi:MAG TPA: hypothetical protein PKA43_09235, partial [Candidatus Competibacter phosphatis]|nr:hypothetical protein [Candidatus Competibacter phosphatis]